MFFEQLNFTSISHFIRRASDTNCILAGVFLCVWMHQFIRGLLMWGQANVMDAQSRSMKARERWQFLLLYQRCIVFLPLSFHPFSFFSAFLHTISPGFCQANEILLQAMNMWDQYFSMLFLCSAYMFGNYTESMFVFMWITVDIFMRSIRFRTCS